ncbi:hypothetical protein Tco_0601725 [Tanacetum coccineum]
MTKSQSFNKHPAYKALYYALMELLLANEEGMDQGVDDSLKQKRKHDDQDEDPSAGPNQGKKTKRRRTIESESSKKSPTSKGNSSPKTSKFGKPVHAEELVDVPTEEVIIDATNDNVVNDSDQLQDDSASKIDTVPRNNWFNQPPRPPTPDPEWKTVQTVDDSQEETWFNDLLSAEKDPLTFDELMATPINFSKFAMNHLKINKLTKAHLVGFVYKLLKDTCYDKDVVHGIKHWGPKCQLFYRSQLNRFSKHDVYSSLKILSVLKEGDFINLYLNDIEDILLLVIQHKLFHLDGEVIMDLAVAQHMPKRKWSAMDKKRAGIMVDLIDKLMLERQIIRNLERLMGTMELEMDYRLMQQTV